MKYILLIGALCFLANKLKSQNIAFDSCIFLKQYEGEWMNVTGTDNIRVYLRFNRNSTSSPSYYIPDKLPGWHEYKQGNVLIERNYENRFMVLSYNGDFDDTNIWSISFHLKSYDFNSSTFT